MIELKKQVSLKELFEIHQRDPRVHGFTCRSEKCKPRGILVPGIDVDSGELFMICPKCYSVQMPWTEFMEAYASMKGLKVI